MPELSSRLRLILAALILIPVLLYWGFAESPSEINPAANSLSDKMDYFIDQAQVREWNEQGQLQRQTETVRLEHDPRQQQNHLTTPISIHYREDGSKIRLTSNEGTIKDDNSRADLAGDVRVHDNPDEANGTVLTTEALTIYPERDYAETALPATLTSPDTVLQGVGMDIDFNTRVLNLHSRVEGTHDNAQ